jgi:hypothetical protein
VLKQPARVVGALMILLCVAQQAAANAIPKYSLEKQARLSDLVVIGHVASLETVPPGFEYARVRVDTILKGSTPAELEVETRGMVAEEDPPCREVGRSYLFFLQRLKNGRFVSVNGPFGVYPLPAK